MYAIIETGGKQYRVSPGDELRVERIEGSVGDSVAFDRVLAVSDEDGTMKSGGEAAVSATIASQGRGTKIDVLKFKRRKMYRRRIGHRQAYTEIKIDSIEA